MNIVDVTSKVQKNILKVRQYMLETINATVSHEMRNPINAIHC